MCTAVDFGARTFPCPHWFIAQAGLNEVLKSSSCYKFFELLLLFFWPGMREYLYSEVISIK